MRYANSENSLLIITDLKERKSDFDLFFSSLIHNYAQYNIIALLIGNFYKYQNGLCRANETKKSEIFRLLNAARDDCAIRFRFTIFRIIRLSVCLSMMHYIGLIAVGMCQLYSIWLLLGVCLFIGSLFILRNDERVERERERESNDIVKQKIYAQAINMYRSQFLSCNKTT